MRNNPTYILGPGPDTAGLLGGILEIIVTLAGIVTATLYPVLKRQNEAAALGFAGSRVLESAGILAGVACLLAIISLKQAGAGNAALITGQTLAILYGRIFLLSQSLMPIANEVLLGVLLYQSRLVPRALPVIAFIGAPLLLVSTLGTLLNLWGQVSWSALLALPVAVFEFFARCLPHRQRLQTISHHLCQRVERGSVMTAVGAGSFRRGRYLASTWVRSSAGIRTQVSRDG